MVFIDRFHCITILFFSSSLLAECFSPAAWKQGCSDARVWALPLRPPARPSPRRQPEPHHVRQPDPHPRDSHWMPQQGGSPGHAPGYKYVEPQPHMDGYTSPRTPYPRLVPASSRQTRYAPPPAGPASHVQVERPGIHASKRQMVSLKKKSLFFSSYDSKCIIWLQGVSDTKMLLHFGHFEKKWFICHWALGP